MASTLEHRINSLFQKKISLFESAISDKDGQWTVKGFIDIFKNIYPMTSDTKVVSKVLEMLIMPIFLDSIKDSNMRVEFAEHQNHYPDLTVIDKKTKEMVAVDLKSTYYTGSNTVNGFTLGAFTGYFRDRNSTKNTTYPYSAYQAHLVLGIIYNKKNVPEAEVFDINQLKEIDSVASDFKFLLQPKWAIATDRPGSGNTKNIGSIIDVENLLDGKGPFTQFKNPEAVFDDYWMNYLTSDMARTVESKVMYNSIDSYLRTKIVPE
jgi:hypothetical protein